MRGLTQGSDGIRILAQDCEGCRGPNFRVQGIDGRNPLWPNCRRVDPSTKRDRGFGLNYHGRLVGTWKGNVGRIFKHRTFKKCQKMKFPELGLPGVESVPTPRGSISLALSVPLRPNTAKNQILRDFGGTPARALYRGCGGAL